MEFPSDSLSGLTTRDKIVTAAEAVALIRDGDTIVVEGFAGQCFAEELTLALEARFLQTGYSPRSDVGVHSGTRGSAGPRHRPVVLRRPAQAGHRRPLGDVGRARQDGRGRQDRGLQPAAGRDRAAVPRYRRGQAGPAHAGRSGHVRRPTQRRRQDQRQDHRGPRRADAHRRPGVPVLQGIRAARRRVPARYHRRPERQHHHGARGVVPGVPGHRHRGAQRRRTRDRAGRTNRRRGSATPEGREDPGRARRLRGRVHARAPLPDLGDPVLPGDERRAASPAVVDTATRAVGAQGDRPARRNGTASQRRGQSRHRHPGRHRQCGRRGARPQLHHSDRRTRSHRRNAHRWSGFRVRDQRRRHPGTARPVRLLRRRRSGCGVSRHGAS